MQKIKEFSKKYLLGFTLGLLSAGVVIVYAQTCFPSKNTTYDNSTSGMQATNVQDAVDELYNTCFSQTITLPDLLPNNPDELYKDEHDDIRYYGANPNNYIYFNCSDQNNQNESTCDLWRIIGLIDGKMKIIKAESIGKRIWDSSQRNNWTRPAELNTYLNGTYYNSINETYKNMISNETYYLGGPTNYVSTTTDYNKLTAGGFYNVERNPNNVNNGTAATTNQYIGLMYPSDYGYAAGKECLSTLLINYSSSCKSKDYLSIGVDEWFQTAFYRTQYNIVHLNSSGTISSSNTFVNQTDSYEVRPTLYLNEDVAIIDGDGSKTNPYQIKKPV